jgi:hypothetical protein
MFKKATLATSRELAVWTVAITLQTAGLGIIATRAADEPSRSNPLPVVVAAHLPTTVPPLNAATLTNSHDSLSIIDPHKSTAAPRSYTSIKRLAQSLKSDGERCNYGSECDGGCCGITENDPYNLRCYAC